MLLPPYYLEVILSGGMACIVNAGLCIGEGSFRCSLNLSPKVLEVSPVYSSLNVRSPALEPADDPTFVFHGVLVLGGNQEVFNGAITFEVGLYAISTTDLFVALT